MFEPKFKYTNDIVSDLINIEKYKTQLEYLDLPTRIKQELMYKAKMKKHISPQALRVMCFLMIRLSG